jgi:hypothetical protein
MSSRFGRYRRNKSRQALRLVVNNRLPVRTAEYTAFDLMFAPFIIWLKIVETIFIDRR